MRRLAPSTVRFAVTGALFALGMATAPLAALAQASYESPERAAQALIDGIQAHDASALRNVLGSDSGKLVPLGGNARARDDVRLFLAAWQEQHRIVAGENGWSYLELGKDNWRFPIPLARSETGGKAGWAFAPKVGANVIRVRRIDRNEAQTLDNVLDYVDAQQYFREVRVKAGQPPEFARKLYSSPGKRDGLYWPKHAGWPDSPMGPVTAKMGAKLSEGRALFGYRYKVLEAQGDGVDGGAHSYVDRGHLTSGFAIIAWPVKYGDTGVHTFVANQSGAVYQKDLGPQTEALASRTERYAPDSSWAVARKKR